MNRKIQCAHCHLQVEANPRSKNQKYCSARGCQRARKRAWQRQKMVMDPDYCANQKNAQDAWCEHNSDYWRRYRQGNPQYVERNRQLQKLRNAKRHSAPKSAKMDASQMIAKMDALEPIYPLKPGGYFIIPQTQSGHLIAKMDALAQKVLIIPEHYESWP